MRVKQLIMKILIASLAMTAVVGLPRGQVKPKTMSLSARQTMQTHAAQKTIALFQQIAVFPDGSQRPLTGGAFAFYRFDIRGRKQYRLKNGQWRLINNPLTTKGVYLAQADHLGVVGVTGKLTNGHFYSERLRLPERYAVKLPLPVKVHVNQGHVTVNGQPVGKNRTLPRIYALRVAVERQ
ncbi:hypothetical protein PF626_09500 [Lacticaseibacillus rhamnosus]|uniref:hypothetical protein n=1 Tax=Lacticaseibacillus rhamnosus TaxID=47715 RepID=UPI0022EBB89D|nr:hypothetical protein [Lacticaseibacillus rhamnosus]MDA3727174.1 hypothetical protein [Lacticaseibacillus rhamnosus]MDA3738076.1 hypothetical protein [Lacticaseibacillus rhamnosus]MDA3743329.1 hypothetical protein [Lacticaseibacillus rhamnosus]MDA3746068.1 hypothetical protein [Lacticaseibacillus rhamnosus]MDA3751523.1 hypothetical protein [Lacticaseibacillus rhamnosus]